MENEQNAVEPEVQETTTEQAVEAPKEIDWKAESRKWEKIARESKGAVEELEQLKESKQEQEARAAEAEAKLAEMTRAKEHAEAVVSVSSKSGVPAEFLEFCADAEQMETFCKLWAEYHGQSVQVLHVGAKAPERMLIQGDAQKPTNAAVFASLFDK